MQIARMVTIGHETLSPWLSAGETLNFHHVEEDQATMTWELVYTVSTAAQTTYYRIAMDQNGDIHRLSTAVQP